MKLYKANCVACGTVFGFTQENIKTSVELGKNRIEIGAYVPCMKCGLNLCVANMETRFANLEEYTDKDRSNNS